DLEDPDKVAVISWYQKSEISRKWSEFRVTLEAPWMVRWVGPIRPIAQTYEVEVEFTPGLRRDDLHFPRKPPRIRVLSPRIERRPETPLDRVPHLYREAHPAELCIYYPPGGEWHEMDSIADTLLPWACEWCARYELWRATGMWTGPGEHPR